VFVWYLPYFVNTSYRANATQGFLQNVVPDFISAEECPTHAPYTNPLYYSVWDTLQKIMYEGRSEPYANLHELRKALRQKWNKIADQTIKESYVAVEKALSSSITKWNGGPIQLIFSWTLVKAADNWLNTLWFFCISTCNTTLLSIFIEVWNVNVNFCVYIEECLLTENIQCIFSLITSA